MVVEVEHADFEGVGVHFCAQIVVLNLQSASEVFSSTGRGCTCKCGCEKSSQMDHDCVLFFLFVQVGFGKVCLILLFLAGNL